MNLLFWRNPDFLRRRAAKKRKKAATLKYRAGANPASATKLLERAAGLEKRAKELENKAAAADANRVAKKFNELSEQYPVGLDLHSVADAIRIMQRARRGAGASRHALVPKTALGRSEEPGSRESSTAEAARATSLKPAAIVLKSQRILADLLRKNGCPPNPAKDANFIALLRNAGFKKPEKVAEFLQVRLASGKTLTAIIAELEKKV